MSSEKPVSHRDNVEWQRQCPGVGSQVDAHSQANPWVCWDKGPIFSILWVQKAIA